MKEKVALISVLANFILAFGKILIGFLTRSSAVMAEGIHSGMDILSSLISFLGIKISKKEADERHPYGHHKFEVLSGLVITIILFLTGLWITYDAYKEFLNPSTVKIGYLSLGVMIFSALINEIMARLKIHYGKKENSVSLISDGIHSRVDVYASLAVFVGLIISKYWIYIDSLLALLVGLYIIKESFSLGKEAVDSLLDVSANKEQEDEIKKILKKYENKDVKFEQLKTQKKGSIITANLKISLPDKLSVAQASEITKKIKKELIEKIEMLEYIAIQVESHNVTESFYEPREILGKIGLGEGFGWQGRGSGPQGYCYCQKCGYEIKHQRGIPCAKIKCPKCNISLLRKN